MKIPYNTIRFGQKSYIDKAAESKRTDAGTKSSAGTKVATDTVSISDTSKEMQQAAPLSSPAPSVDARVEKVEALKKAVSEGTYVIDPEKVAEAILTGVFDEPA